MCVLQKTFYLQNISSRTFFAFVSIIQMHLALFTDILGLFRINWKLSVIFANANFSSTKKLDFQTSRGYNPPHN